ncbi:codeine O-demethylase-like [Actinidia eriantha]|uniref:codeine O-demethylase-like n=1 Tax=Actinidia eriantha TaxID=165200 RepID=UPI0025883478|nr:codeine O-demethylase-like [Actinidia eriantha]
MGSNADEVVIDEDQNVPTYVSSMLVPSVQEMARQNRLEFPERYTRNAEEMPKSTVMNHLYAEMPIIDTLLLSNGQKEELNKLDIACQEWGFFQVVNHGVAKEVLQNMKDAAAEFFDLQIQEKNKFSMASDDIQGYGQRIEIIEAYASEVHRVAEELLGSISSIMWLEKDILLPMHRELMQALRIRHDGEWLPVKPIPNVLVMKAGDVFEIWSDGKNKSIEHRAVTNENKERISFASLETISGNV